MRIGMSDEWSVSEWIVCKLRVSYGHKVKKAK